MTCFRAPPVLKFLLSRRVCHSSCIWRLQQGQCCYQMDFDFFSFFLLILHSAFQQPLLPPCHASNFFFFLHVRSLSSPFIPRVPHTVARTKAQWYLRQKSKVRMATGLLTFFSSFFFKDSSARRENWEGLKRRLCLQCRVFVLLCPEYSRAWSSFSLLWG